MIKLYGNPYSRANRVRWTLEECGVAFEEETVSLGSEGTRSERFLKINPNGHIPVLVDDGTVLFESIPISLYLAKKYSPNALYINEPRNEALVWQWSVWAMTELEKFIETASLHVTWLPAPMRSTEKASAAQAEVLRCLEMLSQALEATDFLVGDRFSVADVIVSEVITNLVHAGVGLDKLDPVLPYVRANLSRAAAQRALAKDIIAPFLG